MSTPTSGSRFTGTDLAYVLSALVASRDAQRAHRLVAEEAHEPRLHAAARRGQIVLDDDIVRIVALLARWNRPEGTAPFAEAGPELSAPPTGAVVPGPAHDLRLVAMLSAHLEAAVLRGRGELIHGFETAARDLAEDHIRGAARDLSALRRALEPEPEPERRLRGSARA